MKHIFFESIDSTNTYLKNNYSSLDDMVFVSADYQTAGKGRNDRNWSSSKGKNLMFSLLLKDPKKIKHYKAISIVSAYSIVKVLESYGIKDLKIKWPNDVYVGDDKICGILLEAVSSNTVECLIVGVGLNVNEKTFEGEYLHRPISMYQILSSETDIRKLKEDVFKEFENNIESLTEGHDFYDEIIRYDYLQGKEVYTILDNEKKKIKVLGIAEDYSLKIQDGGTIRNIESGEITFHV